MSSAHCATQQPSGVTLASPWPPNARSYHDFVIPQGYVPPPYETSGASPSVICLGRDRQLFVDDFLVDTAASNVERAWHTATIHSMHALVPSLPWETGGGQRRTARPFGAGSLIDPTGSKLLLWYRCGWRGSEGRTCVAFSRDGLRFIKPKLGLHGDRHLDGEHRRETNIVIETKHVEAFEVVRDFLSEPPRFVGLRMEFMTGGRRYGPYASYVSADGLRWRKQRNVSQLIMADRSTFFLNPLRRPPMWVYSLRENLCSGGPSGHLRARRFWERPHGDAGQGLTYRPFIQQYFQCAGWRPGEPVPWFGPDGHDCHEGECDVYNVDGLAYESLILHGLAMLFRPNGGELKNNSIHLGFSRDGFHIARPPPPREPFIRLPPRMRPRAGAGQDWLGLGNAQLASGSPIVSASGDELLFYFGYGAASGHHVQSAEGVYDHYDEGTGVARLRRDGFASMRPPAPRPTGMLTTRPLLFNGSRLFLNVVLGSSLARLRVDVLGPHKGSAGDFALLRNRSEAQLSGPLDATLVEVPGRWSEFCGVPLRLRFHLHGPAELFAFWFTHSAQGHSSGFLGGGRFGVAGVVDE